MTAIDWHTVWQIPIQDYYTFETAICYGCGRNNPHGLHIKTYWNGEVGVCEFTPRDEHTAFPGVVYGGLLASIMDCHCIGTAVAAMCQAEGIHPEQNAFTCVTGNLNVNYRKPTPTGVDLRLEARVREMNERKAVIDCSIYAGEVETVQGDLIAVKIKSREGTSGHQVS